MVVHRGMTHTPTFTIDEINMGVDVINATLKMSHTMVGGPDHRAAMAVLSSNAITLELMLTDAAFLAAAWQQWENLYVPESP